MGKIKETGFSEEKIETVLANDIKFKGKLKFSKSLMIKGNFEGEIDALEGHLYIDEKADVKANIEAHTVSNRGKIIGNIKALEKFELFSGAEIKGDITSKDLYIENGSVFNGKSKMQVSKK